MLIAYLTTDEVNQHLALLMAEECSETVCPLTPNDAPPDEDFDAVVYDWDYLPAQRQQAILAELLAGRSPRPVAVHSYNLDEDCVEALRRQDVAVYRGLQPEVFQLLAVQGHPPSNPQCLGGVANPRDGESCDARRPQQAHRGDLSASTSAPGTVSAPPEAPATPS